VAYPQIAAFARLANGSVAPTRSIAGQATKIGRASHDVTYDPVNDEIVVASANAQAVITLPGGANGDTPPRRIIQGPHTQLQSPGYGAAVDWVNNELFVVEGRDRPGEEYILVFPRTANGDVAPLRKIQGSNTMLKNARNIVIDPMRNLIAVSSRNGTLIFNRNDSGNVKPRAIIKGIGGKFRLIPSKGWIVGTGTDANGKEGIGAWSITDNGEVPPFYLLTNPNGDLGGNDIALNPNEKEVILGDRVSVTIYSFPEIFN
jgi:hypothetical protein